MIIAPFCMIIKSIMHHFIYISMNEKIINAKLANMDILKQRKKLVYFVVLNLAIYTDRAVMPAGNIREWHRSPIDRLNIADQSFMLYLQIAVAAVSIITSILLLFGVRSQTVKTIQLISTIGSTVIFIFILILTSTANAHYA